MLINQPNSITNYDVVISSIYWDNIYLHIGLTGDNLENQIFAIASNENAFVFPVDYNPTTDEIVINITNIGCKKMLDNGFWYIKYKNFNYQEELLEYERCFEQASEELRKELLEPTEWNNIQITFDVGYRLKHLDKIYRYSGTCYAYIFTFAPVKKMGQLVCSINCTYMVKSNNPKKRYFKIESKKFITRAKKRLIYFLEEVVINGFYQLVSHITPKDGSRVLLLSETRCPISGNLKALDNRMKERGLDKQFKISYFFSKTLSVNRVKILFIWLKLAFITAKQDYIFVDDYSPFLNNINVNPKTKLIQVWHAGVGFKAVGYARFGRKGSPNPKRCCHRKYDYVIVGGEALREVYAEVFGMDKENCLPCGLMRLDNYLEPDRISDFKERFYKKYPALLGKKIILFAPTFRGTGQRTAYYPYEMLSQEEIYDMCGDEYLFLIKNHPFISETMEIDPKYSDRILDFSLFPDINDLFYVTDILITDYSSSIYEFSLHKKPIIFFAFDKEEYELIRGVHRTLDKYAPGKVCSTFGEVLDTIKNKDFQMEKLYRFVDDNFDTSDGYASDRVIDNILLNKIDK